MSRRQGSVPRSRTEMKNPSKLHLVPTDREVRVLEFVARSIDATGCQPCYREICHKFGWHSPNSVRALVVNLMDKGVVWGTASRGLQFAWRQYL